MATSTFMASFAKDVIEVDVFSEADSVVYELKIGGATDFSAAPYLKRNDADLTGLTAPGLNVRGLRTAGSSTVDHKSFLLTPEDSSMNAGFITWMNTSGHPYLFVFSGPKLKSAPLVDKWMAERGSTCWPGHEVMNKYNCGYVGVFNSKRQKFVAEAHILTDGSDLNLAEISMVFDDLDDLGATGMPSRAIFDGLEYSTTNEYEYKRYPTNLAINKMSDYGLASGCCVEISAELFADQAMVTNGIKTRANLRWYNASNALVDSSGILESDGTGWVAKSQYVAAPPSATGFTIVVSRFPNKGAVVAKSAIRNLVLTETSRDGNKKNGNAAIGIHGVKASGFLESKPGNRLMDMSLTSTSNTNRVPIVAMRESNGTFVAQEIDFTKDQKLPSFLMLRRASEGTYHGDGLSMNMLTAKPNVARFDQSYDMTTKRVSNRGLMVEKQSTNLMGNSGFDDLPINWGSSKAVFTRNANKTIKAKSDDGDRCVWQNQTSNKIMSVQPGKNYVTSLYINGSKRSLYNYWLRNSSGVITFAPVGTVTQTQTANALLERSVVKQPNYSGGAIDGNGDLLLGVNTEETNTWFNFGFYQVEEGLYPTSWIRTTGSPETRMADVLTLNMMNYTGSVLLEYERQDTNEVHKQWIDYTNESFPVISDKLGVGVWLRSIKVCKYLLNDAQKQTMT